MRVVTNAARRPHLVSRSFGDNDEVAISRAERREAREARAREIFGSDASAALDLFELTELAWHDC
jgi:hypothetical protein